MKKDYLLTETVSYRITKKHRAKISEKASKEKKTVNDWCRSLVEQSLDDEHGLAPGMQVLLAEIYSLRQLVESAFDLQAQSLLNADHYLDVVLKSRGSRQKILEKYFKPGNILEGEPEEQTSIDSSAESDSSSPDSGSAQNDEQLPEQSSEDFTDSVENPVVLSEEAVH